MKEVASIQISFLIDRGVRKVKTNVISGGRVWGSLKAV
jgi:hypothetical protein